MQTKEMAVRAANPGLRFVALVIGNQDYQREGKLPGVRNDAQDVAVALREMGFAVINAKLTDLSRADMEVAFSTFLAQLDANTVAMVYYSGHGLEDRGENFLVPVDADVQNEHEVRAKLVSLNGWLNQMAERSTRTRVVVLDACRNMPESLRGKDVAGTGGLASVRVGPGTRLVYAAAPGARALPARANERNSVFTGALLRALGEPLATFDEVINRAAEITIAGTNGYQQPWAAGSLGMTFRLRALMTPAVPQAPVAAPLSGPLRVPDAAPALTAPSAIAPPAPATLPPAPRDSTSVAAAWRSVARIQTQQDTSEKFLIGFGHMGRSLGAMIHSRLPPPPGESSQWRVASESHLVTWSLEDPGKLLSHHKLTIPQHVFTWWQELLFSENEPAWYLLAAPWGQVQRLSYAGTPGEPKDLLRNAKATSNVHAAAFSSDGQRLLSTLSCGRGQEAMSTWDLRTGRCTPIGSTTVKVPVVDQLVADANLKTFALRERYGARVSVGRPPDASAMYALTPPPELGRYIRVHDIAMARDGAWLAVLGGSDPSGPGPIEGRLWLYGTDLAAPTLVLRDVPYYGSVKLRGLDAKHLLLAGSQGSQLLLRVIHVPTGRTVATHVLDDAFYVVDAVYQESRQRLAVALRLKGAVVGSSVGHIEVFDLNLPR